jgi:NAD(P)-dependent dehydrogenase (short-subunit alcohol dehydrogenase family)
MKKYLPCVCAQLDMSSEDAVRQAFEKFFPDGSPLHVLVNNAAKFVFGEVSWNLCFVNICCIQRVASVTAPQYTSSQ